MAGPEKKQSDWESRNPDQEYESLHLRHKVGGKKWKKIHVKGSGIPRTEKKSRSTVFAKKSYMKEVKNFSDETWYKIDKFFNSIKN